MPGIDCSLVADGSSDAALIPVIRWAVEQHATGTVVDVVWADLRRSFRPMRTLADRIAEGVSLYPCDLLFVHRDAEKQSYETREREIRQAVEAARTRGVRVPHVCLIPVRMQEAWLLLDQAAIRRAAGNPNGRMALSMPSVDRIEQLPDPKTFLHDLMRVASGLSGRRLRTFPVCRYARLVSENIGDMAILRQLSAFRRFEDGVRTGVRTALAGCAPRG